MSNIIFKLQNILRRIFPYTEYKIDKSRKTLFLLQTPVHINVGDHFISVAEIQFLERNFSEYNIVEINESRLEHFLTKYVNKVESTDKILIHGGGNLGNEYLHHEKLRRRIINAFPKNKIIILPQTIFFTSDENGQAELKKTIEDYSQHSNLVICARENLSYEFAKLSFKNRVILVPDLVLQYEADAKNNKKAENDPSSNYVVTVFRSDREAIIDETNREDITKILESKFQNIIRTDMFYVDKSTIIDNVAFRQKLIDEKIELFYNSDLIVTDRLHGMIVASITGTPCIAIGNYNHKISESFKWIKDITNTVFIEKLEDFAKGLNYLNETIDKEGNDRKPQMFLNKNYQSLVTEIK